MESLTCNKFNSFLFFVFYLYLSLFIRFFVTPSDSVAIIAANAVQAIPYFSAGLKGVARFSFFKFSASLSLSLSLSHTHTHCGNAKCSNGRLILVYAW
jgi:hypothetical protein